MKRLNDSARPIKTLVSTAIAAIIASSAAHAGSFSLYTESTARAIGNYAAGIAAEAADASTGWYNPAGLALLHGQQMVVGGVGVFPSSELTGTSTYRTPNPFSPGNFLTYTQSFNDINGAKNALVPSFHYAKPFTDTATFGLSIVSPFGLVTDWREGGPVRYAATTSKLFTVNVSPEVGVQITKNVAIGAGLDLQYARVTFNSMLGSPALMSALGNPPTYFDSSSHNRGDSFGGGFHAGIMLMFNDNHSRIGLNYQSEMDHEFEGKSRLHGRLASPGFTNPDATFTSHNLYSNNISLPDITTLSVYHDINESFAVLGSVVYTGWNSLSKIVLNNVAAANPATFSQIKTTSTSILDYDGSWRFALGANYQVNPLLMLRVGGGYDETPTNNEHRDVRIPDSSRWALSAGAHYQARPNIGVDLGYTHLFQASDGKINNTAVLGTSTYNVHAKPDNAVDLVGLQVTWLMDDIAPKDMK